MRLAVVRATWLLGLVFAGCESAPPTGPAVPAPQATSVQVSIGSDQACALAADGRVGCWTRSGPDAGLVAQFVTTSEVFNDLSVGSSHVCGLTSAGSVWCWGDNTFGQLGIGALASQADPVEVVGLPAMVGISAGALHTCAWAADGDAYCWGDNRAGQLGDGSQDDRSSPALVADAHSFDQVRSGRFTTCGLAAMKLLCWGDNEDGIVAGSAAISVAVPTLVADTLDMTRLTLGQRHACGLLAPGGVGCWGRNTDGQLGDGTTEPRVGPVVADGGSTLVEVAAGPTAEHTCGFDQEGLTYCWGLNTAYQSGQDSKTPVLRPTALATSGRVVSLATGWAHSCGVDVQGQVACWGAYLGGFAEPVPVIVSF